MYSSLHKKIIYNSESLERPGNKGEHKGFLNTTKYSIPSPYHIKSCSVQILMHFSMGKYSPSNDVLEKKGGGRGNGNNKI